MAGKRKRLKAFARDSIILLQIGERRKGFVAGC
ncbi:hypothetical protein GALL_325760 [mine drainage metagenome]|uniref:Uncharacterized protein n=1 Tax=mine drainage metagenome TaxID=410659 RepID=A0A1J5QQ96_9ZZZZ